MKNNVVDSILEELNELQSAKILLELVYQEIGPYNDGKISNELMYKLNAYFRFNDSE